MDDSFVSALVQAVALAQQHSWPLVSEAYNTALGIGTSAIALM
jgi:hypothetical protein